MAGDGAGDGAGAGGGGAPAMEADLVQVRGPVGDLTLVFDRTAWHPAPGDCFSVFPLAAEFRRVPRPPV